MKKFYHLFISTLAVLFCVTSCGDKVNSNSSLEQSIPEGYHIVSFDSDGGSDVDNQVIKHGEKIKKPDDPVKLGYNFVNWTYQDEVWSFAGYVVTEDMTLKANWDKEATQYFTITFVNDDGTVLETQKRVEKGSTVVYTGDIPVKPNQEDHYLYTFDGWDKELVAIGNMTFVAQYHQEMSKYFVQYLDYDNSLITKVSTNEEEEAFAYLNVTPEKESDSELQYHFLFWDKVSEEEGAIVYKAIYETCTSGLQFDGSILKSYSGPSTNVTIPETWCGETITTIRRGAFSNAKRIISVSLPNTISAIGDEAFSNCQSLKSISFPNGVTSIGSAVFSGCTSLETFSFPNNGMDYIPIEMFSGCHSLKSVTLPNSIQHIYYSAFYDCGSLSNISLPSSLKTIGQYAFKNTGLRTISLPDSLESIVDGAFDACYLLQYNVLDNISYLGNNNNPYLWLAKVNDQSLESYSIASTCRFISKEAFKNCSSMKSIIVPDSVIDIGLGAFAGCNSIESMTLPFVGKNSQNNCFLSWLFGASSHSSSVTPSTLKTVNISDKCTNIGNNAFNYLSNIETITLGINIETIGEYAFSGCYKLASINIPEKVTSIGKFAFSSCKKLQTITIPDGVEIIAQSTFSNCSSLETINLGNGVRIIESNAFAGCSNLQYYEDADGYYLGNADNNYLCFFTGKNKDSTLITIHNGCLVVYSYAFQGFDNLVSVVLPDTIISISQSAFPSLSSDWYSEGMPLFKNVYFLGSSEEFDSIIVDDYNPKFSEADKYFYCESSPTETGNFWHYVDGTPVSW